MWNLKNTHETTHNKFGINNSFQFLVDKIQTGLLMKELPNSKTSYEIEKLWKKKFEKIKKKKKNGYTIIVIFSILGQFGTNRKPESDLKFS